MTMVCFGIFIMTCTLQSPAASQGATFCNVYRPILWSKQDTRGTKEQVDKLNRAFKRICRK